MRFGAALCAFALAGAVLIVPSLHPRRRAVPQSAARAVFFTPTNQTVRQDLASLPLAFEPNRGQASPRVKFVARANDAAVLLRQRGVVVAWPAATRRGYQTNPTRGEALRLDFAGANTAVRVTGHSMLRGKTNYLLGRDPRKWLTNVPQYSTVRYEDLYRGINAQFYGGPSGLEYDLVALPGSAPRGIRLRIRGARGIRFGRRGELILRMDKRQIVMRRPRIYQTEQGHRIAVSGGYRSLGHDVFGFVIGKHRADLPLVIDPSISIAYTTFLGGTGAEKGNSVAVDSTGDVYVGGSTTLATFPESATASLGPLGGSSDLFVAKIDPTQSRGASLIYLTFIGGSKNDQGGMVALDNSVAPPNLAILGWTTSPDFPVTNSSTLNGPSDITVTKLNGSGSNFIYSEYFGGSGAEATQNAGGIATDALGDVFVTSDTNSTNLPMTPPVVNGFQPVYGGGASDGFLAEFDPIAGSLLYFTYFGINATVGSTSVAVDASGNAYVAGFTSSPTAFPATIALQTTYAGGADDAFVMEINPTVIPASQLVYASLLGGSASDQATSIAVDGSVPPNAYVTGVTSSNNFYPVTSGTAVNAPFQLTLKGTSNAFLIVISQTAAGVPSLEYATYLGGTGIDAGEGVSVVSPSQVYIVGNTTSDDFPDLCSLQGFSGTQDAFLAEINPTAGGAASLLYTTLLGGSVTAEANAVAADSTGDAIVFGDTLSPDYPLAASPNNGFQPTCTSCAVAPPLADALLTQVDVGTNPTACVAFSPPVINLGSFPTGTTSPPQNTVLTNNGDPSTTLTISSITIVGANASDFSLQTTGANACQAGVAVAQGLTCDFSVTFAPSLVGPETATLEVADNGVGAPQTVNLSGTGTSPEISLSPTSLAFGSVAQGTTSNPQTVALANTGNDTLNVTAASISGTNPTDFVFAGANTCSPNATVSPGGNCTVAVEFAPNEPNPPQNLSAQAVISFTDITNSSTGAATIPLSGTEASAPAPAVSLTATTLAFGSENVGGSTTQPAVTLKNTGSAALSVSSIGITGANAGDFTQTNTCPVAPNATLSAGSTCTISVTFQPATAGLLAADVTISDNATPSPQTISLTGTGTLPGISLSPASLTFAGQDVGPPPSAPQNVTLTNTGTGPLAISGISFTGANPGDFAQTNNCPLAPAATLNTGTSCIISVTFDPTATGSRSASLSVADNAPQSPQAVALSGTGTAPAVQLAPGSLQFASTVVGTESGNKPVLATNIGNGPLVITGASFAGPDGGDFQATGTCIGTNGSTVTVAAGGNCTVDVNFLPLAAGTRTAALGLNGNASANPTVSITGTATDFQLGPIQGGTTSTTVTAGESALFSMQVTPINGFLGTVTLACSNPPAGGACTVSPSSVGISGAAPVSFTVNVSTTAHSLFAPLRAPISRRTEPPVLLSIAALLFVLLFLTFPWHLKGKARLLRPVMLLSLLWLFSCGGGRSSSTSATGTPPGTYTVTMTGAVSGTTRTVNLSITVQ